MSSSSGHTSRSLAEVCPELVLEWHPTKNGDVTASDVAARSKKKAWWLGTCGHEWESSITNRSRGTRCPYCAGKKALVGTNDLATTHPAVAAMWHPTKNELTPQDVTSGSLKRAMWIDSQCGHEWEKIIVGQVDQPACPYCSGTRVLAGFNDLATKYPEMAAQWHPTKNGNLLPTEVVPGSNKRVYWICDVGHEWDTMVHSRTKGRITGCPTCSGQKFLQGYNDLATTHPDIAADWHPTKNDGVLPSEVSPGSNKVVWWLGAQCGHEWKISPNNRTHKGSGCGVCRGRIIIPGDNDLATTHPHIAADWHPTKNGDLTPSQVIGNSSKHAWWLGKCGHEWRSLIYSKTRGYNCPFCSNQRLLAGFNDLLTVNPLLAEEWHTSKNGDLTPSDVQAGSETRVWWQCASNPEHEWRIQVSARHLKGTGCPACKRFTSKPETALYEALKLHYVQAQQSVTIPIRWNVIHNANIDIFIPDLNVIIEYDGWYWHKDRLPQDIQKTTALLDAGYTVIRVRAHPLVSTGISHTAYTEVVHTDESPEDLADMVVSTIAPR